MATLTAAQLKKGRRLLAEALDLNLPAEQIDYVKNIANSSFQAAEDWAEKGSTKSSVKADIDAANGSVLTNGQIAKLVWVYFHLKSAKELGL